MTEFTELDLGKEVDDMDEEELRTTLSDFMQEHEQNIEAYDGLETEHKEQLSEKDERIEDLQDRVSEFKQARAEDAAEHVKMPADVLAERFSFAELDQIIEEAEEFAEEDESEEESEEESKYLTDFAQREQKGKQEGGGRGPSKKHRDRAASALRNNGFPASE